MDFKWLSLNMVITFSKVIITLILLSIKIIELLEKGLYIERESMEISYVSTCITI